MRKLAVSIDGEEFDLALDRQCGSLAAYRVSVNGRDVNVVVPADCEHLEDIDWLIVDGRPYEISFDPDLRWVNGDYGRRQIRVRDLELLNPRPLCRDGVVCAPIPGVIAGVHVAAGQKVTMGQPLLVLEAMKMQNEIRAPRPGTIAAVHVGAGQTVGQSERLVEIE